jgi:hypothetical protein
METSYFQQQQQPQQQQFGFFIKVLAEQQRPVKKLEQINHTQIT